MDLYLSLSPVTDASGAARVKLVSIVVLFSGQVMIAYRFWSPFKSGAEDLGMGKFGHSAISSMSSMTLKINPSG